MNPLSLSIKELMTEDDWRKAFSVMNQLRTHLTENLYLELVRDARKTDGYRMAAIFEEEQLVAVIGFKPMITLYYGRFIRVCDLVTDQARRSKGYGEKLLAHVHQWAKENQYESVALSSGLQRTDAHRFYEQKMDYEKVSYVFKAPLH